MSYFVTGGTGFIGQNLIGLLLKRRGKIYVLVRKGSMHKLDALKGRLGKAADRIIPVTGDLTKARLGVSAAKRKQLEGKIDHVFHLAAIYDMKADAASQEAYDNAIAAGEEAITPSEIKKQAKAQKMGVPATNVPKCLQRLKEKNLVRLVSRGRYDIEDRMFRSYVRQRSDVTE